jgi:hypothetical protein
MPEQSHSGEIKSRRGRHPIECAFALIQPRDFGQNGDVPILTKTTIRSHDVSIRRSAYRSDYKT